MMNIGPVPRFGARMQPPDPERLRPDDLHPLVGTLWNHELDDEPDTLIQRFAKTGDSRITVSTERPPEEDCVQGIVRVNGQPFGEPLRKEEPWQDFLNKLLDRTREAASHLGL